MTIINVNKQHKESLSIIDKIALVITSMVGSMLCAAIFAGLALVSLPAAIQGGAFTLVSWISQTFLQLVLLSIIMVGQNLQNRHTEMRAEEDFKINVKAEKEIEDIQRKLDILVKKIK